MDKHRGRGNDGDAQASPAVATPKSKARTKPANKRPSSPAPTGASQSVHAQGKCYFYNRELFDSGAPGCKLGDNCKWKHEKMTNAEWEDAKSRPPSRSPSPKPKGKGRNGKGKRKGNYSPIDVSECCPAFLQTNKCDAVSSGEGCLKRYHLTQDGLDRENARRLKAASEQ